MARAKLNPILDELSGKVGDLVFREVDGKTVISRNPDRSAIPPTAGQLAQRERFREATFYGRSVMADPTARAFYEVLAQQRRKPIFSITVEDFLKPPVVDEIDASAYTGATGDPLLIRAHDDVEVTGVTVTITDDAGTELESGPAVADEWRWRYDAQTDVPSGTEVTITARALDRPGNAGELAETVTTP